MKTQTVNDLITALMQDYQGTDSIISYVVKIDRGTSTSEMKYSARNHKKMLERRAEL